MSDWVCIKDMELSNSVIWKVWNTCGKNAFLHWVFCKKQKQPKLWWNCFFVFLKPALKTPLSQEHITIWTTWRIYSGKWLLIFYNPMLSAFICRQMWLDNGWVIDWIGGGRTVCASSLRNQEQQLFRPPFTNVIHLPPRDCWGDREAGCAIRA